MPSDYKKFWKFYLLQRALTCTPGGLSAYIGIIQNASLDFQPIDGLHRLHRLHHKTPTVWCYYVFPTLKGILNAALSFWPIHGWKNAQPSESLRQRTAWQQETWSLCSRCWLTMTEKTIELGFGPSFPFFDNAGKRKAIHIASKYIQIHVLTHLSFFFGNARPPFMVRFPPPCPFLGGWVWSFWNRQLRSLNTCIVNTFYVMTLTCAHSLILFLWECTATIYGEVSSPL